MTTEKERLDALFEAGELNEDDYIRVPKTFKADGKDVTIESSDDYVSMAQKGHNFEKKMTDVIRPNRQVLQLLEIVPGAKDNLNKFVLDYYKKGDDKGIKDVPVKDAPVPEKVFDYVGHKRDLRIHFDLNQAQYGEVEQKMIENLKADLASGKINREYVDLVDAGPDTYEQEIRKAHENWLTAKTAEANKAKGKGTGDLPLPPRVMPGGAKDTSFAPDETAPTGDYVWDLDSKEFEKLGTAVRDGASPILE